MSATRSARPDASPLALITAIAGSFVLAACATARPDGAASTPSASAAIASAAGCGTTRLDSLEVIDAFRRIAASTEPGPAKMRAGVGITAPVLAAGDSVRFSDDPEVCRRAAAAYARSFGAAPAGRGVLVTRFGPYWLVARPDGRPRPYGMLLDDAFQQRGLWGL
ncbi:hypothetical protein [Roseisolibacter agri]|nr:hypothetical protein [Roseisolibacter agri]